MRDTRAEDSVFVEECGSGVINDLTQREVEVCRAARAIVVWARTDRPEIDAPAFGTAESVGTQIGAGAYFV
jgi:hypothetical protein